MPHWTATCPNRRLLTRIVVHPTTRMFMFPRRLLAVAFGAALSASTAAAQTTVQATLTSPAAPGGTAIVSPFGYYMSPYTGAVDNGSGVRFNCVDFFHDALLNVPWLARQTNLGAIISDPSLLGNTREGSNGQYSVVDAVKLYQQVAWLSDQYPVNPGANANSVSLTNAIQTAIWAIANNQPNNAFTNTNQYYGPLGGTTSNPYDTQYWITTAGSEYSQQNAGYYDKFYILTDVETVGGAGGGQEFIYSSTPEPGTMMLFGSGLAGLAARAAARRRRKSDSAEELSDSVEAGALS
jgi:hypothetical protein